VEGNVVNHPFVCSRVEARLVLGLAAVLLGACQGPSEPTSETVEVEASRAPGIPTPASKVGAVQTTRAERVAALRKALERPLSRSFEGLKVETLASGQRTVHLEGRFGHATLLRIKPDGTRERGCFDDAEHAVEFATRDDGQP
jgi:hypothetical protein